MKNETQPSPAAPRETPRARRALLDYLQLGPGRTFPALLQRYTALENPPTTRLGTLHKWSFVYNWSRRASRFDAREEQRLQAEFRAEREAVMRTGLALDHQRVQRLISLYQKLDALLQSDEAFWVTDVKTLRLEDGHVERVELRRFNGELIRYLRGLLADIATETGGRFNPSSLPVPPEKPALTMEQVSLEVLTFTERTEFLRLQDKIFSRPAGRALTPQNTD